MQSSIHTPRQNDGPGAPDDEFHRAQTLRKSRAKKFLSDEMAMYSLLVALTFHHYLSCITKVGFRLMDADRRDISKEQLPQRQRQKREKRRLRFKGAQAFHIEDPPCEETSKFADIFSSAQKVVSLFWKALTAPEALTKSHFAIPAAFYPASRSRDDMRKQVSEDILKSIAQLKWRLLIQQLRTPYSFLDPETECDPTTLTSSPTCCLDPFWGRQVQSDLKHADDPVARLEGHIKAFSENARGVSHREETMHASQRVLASGWRSKAPLFRSQAAGMVCQTSLRNYTSRTGQSCQQAPKHVIQAARSARVKKITHKRPRQYGSPLFTYINSMKQEGSTLTNEELREAWKGLCHADRADWKRKHVARVATKRVISNATAANLEAKTERNLSDLSPWQIGSARFPLQEQHLESFMLPFRNKASGLVQLSNSKTLVLGSTILWMHALWLPKQHLGSPSQTTQKRSRISWIQKDVFLAAWIFTRDCAKRRMLLWCLRLWLWLKVFPVTTLWSWLKNPQALKKNDLLSTFALSQDWGVWTCFLSKNYSLTIDSIYQCQYQYHFTWFSCIWS